MKFLRKNIKFIAGILVSATIATGITAYATYSYFADSVSYTKTGTQTEISVEDALNELYSRTNNNSNNLLDYCINILNGSTNDFSISRGLIPILTSNIGSNGEAFCNTPVYVYGSSYDAFKAFNGDLSGNDKTLWVSYVLENNYGYVGYKFNQATRANLFYVNTMKTDSNYGVCMKEFVLQASNDNSNWVDLTDTILHSPNTKKYYKITKNQGSYMYYRLYGKSDGTYSLIGVSELQLFNV